MYREIFVVSFNDSYKEHLNIPRGTNVDFLGAFDKLPKSLSASLYLSVCLCFCPSAWDSSAPTRRIFVTSDV